MAGRVRLSKRQVALFPVTTGEGADGMEANPELIEALADLLLEALGDEFRNEEGGDEPEDHV